MLTLESNIFNISANGNYRNAAIWLPWDFPFQIFGILTAKSFMRPPMSLFKESFGC